MNSRGRLIGVACTSTLHVVDTIPPVTASIETLLWPPNQATHDVAIADCVGVTDSCDAAVKVSFTWVSSDEPATVNGSGHTSPDVEVVDCGHVRDRGLPCFG